MKSFALLNSWLRREASPDATRNLLGFADPFPATVAAVSVAVGFLAARFIKSTAEDLRYDDAGRDAARGARTPVRQAQRPRTQTAA